MKPSLPLCLYAAAGLALAGPGLARAAAAKAAKAKPRPAQPMAFAPGELDLAPGETYPVELFVSSPTGKAVQGKLTYTPGKGVNVRPDARWSGKVPGWGTKTYPKITADPDATGDVPVEAALEKGGHTTLTVHVAPPQVEVVPRHASLNVKVTNPFKSRPMTGRVVASNPDRFLQDITTREFKIAPGETQEVVFPLPGAAPAEGETYEFTIRVETYQGYRTQKKYPLMFPPQDEK